MRYSRRLWGASFGLALAAGQVLAADPQTPQWLPRTVPPASPCPTPWYPTAPGLPAPTVPGGALPSTPTAPTAPTAPPSATPSTPTSPTAPTTPTTPSAPTAPTPPTTPAAPTDAGAGAGATPPGSFAEGPEGGGGGSASFSPTMLGDILGIPAIAFAPRRVGQAGVPASPVVVPSARGFKISENESPRPLDRVFVTYNFYNDVNDALNQRLANGIRNVDVHSVTFGGEKTFLDGDASIGVRLPLYTVSADGTRPELGQQSTSTGDLTMILKYVLWRNPETGSLFSGGLTVTAPTGPDKFAGSDIFQQPIHSTILQPYVGAIWQGERVYLHGFTAVQVPTDDRDVTLLTNDFGIGYYLVDRRGEDRWLKTVVPTFEVHVNTPLNHRGTRNLGDISGTPDFVNLTMGAVFGLGQRSSLAVAYATPVTGPRPFDFEILVQFNWRFGARAAEGFGTMVGN